MWSKAIGVTSDPDLYREVQEMDVYPPTPAGKGEEIISGMSTRLYD